MAKKTKPVEAGDPVSFRLPVNTPIEVLNHLTNLKGSGEFGKECSRVFINAIQEKISDAPMISLELPEALPPEKQQWIESKESQRIIGKWLHQLLTEKSTTTIEVPSEVTEEKISMPEPVQNLFNGLMAGMDDD